MPAALRRRRRALGSGLLIFYQSGSPLAGENFVRGSVAYQRDANGVYQQVLTDVKRKSHYTGGVCRTLLEGSRTNSILWSRDLTNAVWGISGTVTKTLNAVGLDGTPNSATTIADNDAAVQGYISQTVTIPVDSATHCVSFIIAKDSNQARFVWCYLTIIGGTQVARGVWLNTQTGAALGSSVAGVSTQRVIDAGLWWIVEIAMTNNSTAANTSLRCEFHPARGTIFGTADVTTTGSAVVGQMQFELNSTFCSSPIFTTTAAVTRAGENYSFPPSFLPSDLTIYAKYIALGSQSGNERVLQIGNNTNVAGKGSYVLNFSSPTIRVQGSFKDPTGAFNNSTPGNAGAFGDLLESRAAFSMTSQQVTCGMTVNSGVENVGAISPVGAPFTDWSVGSFYIGSVGGITPSFIELESFKVLSGIRSLAEMRAA